MCTSELNRRQLYCSEGVAIGIRSIFYRSLGAQPAGVQCFLHLFFHVFGVFRSSFLFLCNWTSFMFSFTTDQSLYNSILTLGGFQAWDYLSYPLNLWFQRRNRGTCGSEIVVQISALAEVEPRTSHLAV